MDISNLILFWNNYFHNSETSLGIALFRVCIGICVFYEFFIAYYKNQKFFSKNGYYSSEFRANYDGGYETLLEKFDNINLYFGISMIISISFIFGFLTQISCIALIVFFNQMINRNIYLYHSAHSTISIALFLMVFSHADTNLSIDSYLGINSLFPSFNCFNVLLKIQIAYVLIYAYYSKISISDHRFSWLDGSTLYYSLQNFCYTRKFVHKISLFKKENITFIKYLGYFVLFLQLIFGLTALIPDLWLVSVSSLILMQLGFLTFLRLGPFPYVYISAAFLFIPNEIFQKYLGFLF